MKIGILALQGAVRPHATKLTKLGVEPVEVRNASDLTDLAGIILPGGESTAMLNLLHLNQLFEPIKRFVSQRPSFGFCAGIILLAKKVSHPEQESFGVLPIEVARNAYGRQVDSFITWLNPTETFNESGGKPIEGVFIRAPRILSSELKVKILLKRDDEPVMLEYGQTLGATFHPELTESNAIHRYFINKCRVKL